jgi:hypothetical protein
MKAVRKDYVRPVDFKHGVVEMTHAGCAGSNAQLLAQ